MSLLDTLDTMGVVLQDALATCGYPTRLSRYVLEPPADNCCDSPENDLVIWWDSIEPSRSARPGTGTQPCGLPVARLNARWLRCWPTGTPNANGTLTIPTAELQAVTQIVTEVADCGFCALRHATCEGGMIAATCRGVQLDRAVPVRPSGGCVGIKWSLLATFACD